MANRSVPVFTATFAALVLAGCGPSDRAAVPIETADVVRTADPATRGFTEADFPRVQEIARDVYTYEALRSAGDERFTTVSLFVVTNEGVLVADGQGSVDETARMLEHIADVTDRPVTHVVVCSDHGDHTAGNSAFPRDAAFYAHPTSIEVLRASAANPIRPADAPPVVVPTEAVSDLRILELGEKEVHVLFLGRAHTGGDLVVYLPDEKVLFMSEAYLNRIFPAMRSAYPSEWIAMLGRALEMDVDVYVPGHGFVEQPDVLEEELVTFRDAVRTVVDETSVLFARGRTADEAVTEADFGPLESWSLRDSQRETAIRRVYLELTGGLAGG